MRYFISDEETRCVLFSTHSGREPVREWLLELSENDRRIIGQDIATVEFGWPIGMPVCRSLGQDLWEIRSDISHKRIARVIFSPVAGRMILLHGFGKKSRKTPIYDLKVAVRRLKELGSD